MKNTYWNSNGKYQQEADKLSELMPDMGYTNNEYVNLFITVSHIYYRRYNDGDLFTEFEECISKYIEPFSTEIDFNSYKDYEGQELEDLVSRIIEFVKNKDLSYQAVE